MIRAPSDVATRLYQRLVRDPTTGCINWTGHVDHHGYGRIWDGSIRRSLRVYRLAYELVRGPVPDGHQIDHLCRNRLCCNPDHLEAVTPRENQLRGNGISGRHARQTHCKHGHEFTPENTYSDGPNRRHCRTCRAAANEARKARRREHRDEQENPPTIKAGER